MTTRIERLQARADKLEALIHQANETPSQKNARALGYPVEHAPDEPRPTASARAAAQLLNGDSAT